MAYGTYQTRNPKAVHTPVRSIPLFRSATAVFGPTPDFAARVTLASKREELTMVEAFFARACGALGNANRSKASLRRGRQATAMRLLNRARADLRRARKALAAAEVAMLAFVGEVA